MGLAISCQIRYRERPLKKYKYKVCVLPHDVDASSCTLSQKYRGIARLEGLDFHVYPVCNPDTTSLRERRVLSWAVLMYRDYLRVMESDNDLWLSNYRLGCFFERMYTEYNHIGLKYEVVEVAEEAELVGYVPHLTKELGYDVVVSREKSLIYRHIVACENSETRDQLFEFCLVHLNENCLFNDKADAETYVRMFCETCDESVSELRIILLYGSH